MSERPLIEIIEEWYEKMKYKRPPVITTFRFPVVEEQKLEIKKYWRDQEIAEEVERRLNKASGRNFSG